jgi:CheY-like chemotaxis protein
MPEMDGIEATQRIRNQWSQDWQPYIVAMTAHAMEEDRHWCLSAGMDNYLRKPVELDQLISVLLKVPNSTSHAEMGAEIGTSSHIPLPRNYHRYNVKGDEATLPTKANISTASSAASSTSSPNAANLPEFSEFSKSSKLPSNLTELSEEPLDCDAYRTFLSMIGNDVDLARELIRIFLEDIPAKLTAIQQANAGGALSEIQRLAHSFKSSSAQLGAMRLSGMSRELEVKGKEGSNDGVSELIQQLAIECERVQELLREKLRGDIIPKS